jgi:hypothetical protein
MTSELRIGFWKQCEALVTAGVGAPVHLTSQRLPSIDVSFARTLLHASVMPPSLMPRSCRSASAKRWRSHERVGSGMWRLMS